MRSYEFGVAPGSLMAEKMGAVEVSEPETANTCITNGAALVRVTVKVWEALVSGVFTEYTAETKAKEPVPP